MKLFMNDLLSSLSPTTSSSSRKVVNGTSSGNMKVVIVDDNARIRHQHQHHHQRDPATQNSCNQPKRRSSQSPTPPITNRQRKVQLLIFQIDDTNMPGWRAARASLETKLTYCLFTSASY